MPRFEPGESPLPITWCRCGTPSVYVVLNDGTTAVARTRCVGRLHRAETLTNAANHAQASVVRVDIKAQDPVIQLSIRNDAIGRANHARGSGLLGLRDRTSTRSAGAW
jgi:glucose-6-phosphate-specific signal transduction histidine kinase